MYDIQSYHEDFLRINRMMQEKGVFTHYKFHKSYYTGYAYETLYDWDQYFETLIQLYLGWKTDYARNGVEIFLDLEKENGHIQRSTDLRDLDNTNSAQLSEHVKPFLSQICLLIYNRDGQVDFLKEQEFHYYQRLEKYLRYWLYRDGNYDGFAFWDSAPHTGMDNQHERAGYWYDDISCGVDLNSYLVRECRAFALLSGLVGQPEKEKEYRETADRLAEHIRTAMWDSKDGFFYDIDRRTGKQIHVRTIGAFAAMWAGVATKEQARSMVENYLLNPDEFNRAFKYPALAASEPGYSETPIKDDLGCCWRANTWIPTNYYVFEGLRRYGYDGEAKELADDTYRHVKAIGDREYYATESETGCGLNPFWGWSLLAYFMPYEAEVGYDPTHIALEPNTHILLPSLS